MERKRILVVDDEQDLCDILLFNLAWAGYEPQAVHSAEEAMSLDVCSFDLLLLDVMMDGMSGFELAKRLKGSEQTNHIPIIFLTAKDTEDDALQGFGLGADDYIKKPFSVREVVARVKAVLSRFSQGRSSEKPKVLSFEGLTVDLVQKTVTADGKRLELTRTEFALLSLMLRHRGRVFTRHELIGLVWPKGVIVTNRAVDVNITRMRKKIGSYAAHVVTRQGFGYMFQ